MKLLEPSRRQDHYPEASAGRSMVSKVPVARPTDLAGEVIDGLQGREWDTISYIYVIDEEGVLMGVVSLSSLFAATPFTPVERVMNSRLVTITPLADQEEVIILAVQQKKKAIPVVDERRRLLGVVPPHRILEIMQQEHIEDLLRLVGVMNHVTLTERTWGLVKSRLPWLLLGLAGGMMAAYAVSFFESALMEDLALAFFVPLVVYMADAVGTQTETIFIRSLSFGVTRIAAYVWREMKIGLSIGLIFGALSFIFIFLFWGKTDLAMIIALSMVMTISAAVLIAVLVPWTLFKMKKDPAYGSGPFATVVQDILSIIFYFTIATAFLAWR